MLRIRYGGELSQRCLEVFDDFGGNDVRIGKIAGVFEARFLNDSDLRTLVVTPIT